MAPFAKKNRSKVACNNCRNSKIRCSNPDNNPRCRRCEKFDLTCLYTLKESQLKRNITTYPSVNTTVRNLGLTPKNEKSANVSNIIWPPKNIIMEVVELFFDNQYYGIFPFIHKSSFREFLSSDSFCPESYVTDYEEIISKGKQTNPLHFPDPVLLLAILALCSRLHPSMPDLYGSYFDPILDRPVGEHEFSQAGSKGVVSSHESEIYDLRASNASKYFGWHARNLLKEAFDSPSLQRVQTLSILSSHEWGEANSARSFVYVGIAARMALILGLGEERSLNANAKVSDDISDIILAESKRRTIWSVYMMDRCSSSGKHRAAAIKITDIHVRLPNSEKDFFSGLPNENPNFWEAKAFIDGGDIAKVKDLPSAALTLVLFELWSKIAKWVGEIGAKNESIPLWNPESSYMKLVEELDCFVRSIPDHLMFNEENLEIQVSHNQGGHYGYFHGLLFLSRIFLLREYFFSDPSKLPFGSWRSRGLALLKSIEDLTYMISTLKRKDAMVTAPFTGFQVFTASITSLYFYACPFKIMRKYFVGKDCMDNDISEEIHYLKQKFKDLAYENFSMINEWAASWDIARRWYYSIIQLERVFEECLLEGRLASQDDIVTHKMHEYGEVKIEEIYDRGETQRKEMAIENLLSTTDDSHNIDDAHGFVGQFSRTLKEISRDDLIGGFVSSPMVDLFSNI